MSRKFFNSRWPCSEAMLSGWNCTPCTGRRRVSEPHDEAVLGVRRHGQFLRQARALDHERMVARRLEGRVDAAEDAGAGWRIAESLPCTGVGARTTRPPKASPIA